MSSEDFEASMAENAALIVEAASSTEDPPMKFPSMEEMFALAMIEMIKYTAMGWQKQDRSVPRLFCNPLLVEYIGKVIEACESTNDPTLAMKNVQSAIIAQAEEALRLYAEAPFPRPFATEEELEKEIPKPEV
jgi:hypothetical protein